MKEKIKEYLRRLKNLEEKRDDCISHWQEISDYILPNRGKYLSQGEESGEGKKKTDKIIDSIATRALRNLAAGMMGGLTSPARPWFRLGLTDEDLVDFRPVKEWLNFVEQKMYNVFARSNFYSSIHDVYTELPGFGTACLYEEEDLKDHIRFRVMTVGEYCVANDASGRADTVYRRFWMTARQMAEKFGKGKLSTGVEGILEKNPDKSFQVVHACQPRKNRDADKVDSFNMPWESVYFEYNQSEKVLSEKGYQEFPYMIPKWMVSGSDVYGRGPGMDALPDVKMLQEMQKGSVKGLHKTLDPPMRVPSTFKDRLKTLPAGINRIDAVHPEAVGPLYQIKFDTAAVEVKIERIQMAVRESLFNDLFLMILETPKMTATEVMERHEEKFLLLGPVIERQAHELLDPCIDRTFAILQRQMSIPPPPEEIQGMDLKVEYISILAQAQKMIATRSVEQMVNFVSVISQIKPEILDKIDFDEAVEQFSDAIGTPAKMIRPDKEVKKIRDARLKAAQEQQAKEEAQEMLGGAKALSEIDMEKKSALTEAIGLLGGGSAS